MELKLLFIEGNDNLFMLDELFNRKMKDLDKSIADEIINQIIMNANGLPVKETYSQTIYGVVKKSNPFFFKLDFIHEEEYIPILLDIEQVQLEEYLDSINQNNYLKDGPR